ncbi:very short patch repair endonuclease [Mucilaginibacter sp. OK283]|jgi:DNA mismatch endonuclease (patch repair protein)|uniref:very short patch repair endonuclease n=1 Tax=Mucilaginibacter sp. OK283 TaxID=1881049 RepID=UPI0008BABCCC|nr:very short patch repair endonuclease [Mucilaginibacter sp. OK283]SEP36767.1 T/G mismatch-specific endonuclease [Mucilaginibacter sp. OK283]
MTDIHSAQVRSYNMSRVKNKNTKPELLVRRFLFSKGYRYRLHDKKLPGKPDIILPKYKTVIFVNGCFWHGHESCKYYTIPKTRTEWWIKKINGNIFNDRLVRDTLKKSGWKIVDVWGCELKSSLIHNTLNNLIEKILH